MKKIVCFESLGKVVYKIDVDLSTVNTHIEDSYKVSKYYIKPVLEELIKDDESSYLAINKIPLKKMVEEWKAHNLLYELHIARNRTKDADLDIFETKLRRFGYKILSKIYDLFY